MRTFLCSIFLLTALSGFNQTIRNYDGNLKDQFGGAIGNGKLSIKETVDSVSFILTKGPGLFDSLIVFYIDAQSGGINSTSSLSGSSTDRYLAATAGHHPQKGRSILNFPPDFLPDGAITFDKDGGKFFYFINIYGVTLIQEGTNFTIEPSGTNSAPQYTQKIAKADIGLSGSLNFKFVGNYIGQSASRSNEAFGDPFNNYSRNASAASYNPYTIASYFTFPNNVLPVKLTDFKAAKTGNGVNLAWSVAQESNIDDYQLQRSNDGISFSNIATVKAKNSPVASSYAINDRLPLKGANYYRLLINEKGEKTYSRVITLQFDGSTRQFSAFVNSNKVITVAVSAIQAGTYGLSLINSNGQVVVSKNILIDGTAQNLQLEMPQHVTKGIYHVVLQSRLVKLNTNILVQ